MATAVDKEDEDDNTVALSSVVYHENDPIIARSIEISSEIIPSSQPDQDHDSPSLAVAMHDRGFEVSRRQGVLNQGHEDFALNLSVASFGEVDMARSEPAPLPLGTAKNRSSTSLKRAVPSPGSVERLSKRPRLSTAPQPSPIVQLLEKPASQTSLAGHETSPQQLDPPPLLDYPHPQSSTLDRTCTASPHETPRWTIAHCPPPNSSQKDRKPPQVGPRPPTQSATAHTDSEDSDELEFGPSKPLVLPQRKPAYPALNVKARYAGKR
jgi:hypothetical protein